MKASRAVRPDRMSGPASSQAGSEGGLADRADCRRRQDAAAGMEIAGPVFTKAHLDKLPVEY